MTTLPSSSELGLWQAEPHIVMHHLMNLLEISDATMGDALGLSRQSVYNRRTGRSSMTSADIKEVSRVLGVDPRLFMATPAEAIQWLIEKTNPSPDGEQGADLIALRANSLRLADSLTSSSDVPEWFLPDVDRLAS